MVNRECDSCEGFRLEKDTEKDECTLFDKFSTLQHKELLEGF